MRSFPLKFFIFFVIGLLIAWWNVRSESALEPVWTRVQYAQKSEIVRTSMPVKLPEEPLTVFVDTEFTVNTPLSQIFFRQDDCISSIVLNGKPVTIPTTPYCDYNRGLHLDVGEALKVGTNSLSLVLTNAGGPGGLSVTRSGADPRVRTVRIRTAVLLFALFVVWQFIGRSTTLRYDPLAWSKLYLPLRFTTVVGGVFLAWTLRFLLMPYETNDSRSFIIPWFDYITTHGQFASFSTAFSDYAPSYLYLLSLVSPLASYFPKLAVIKMITLIFDFILAYGIFRIVDLFLEERSDFPLLALFGVLFLPTVVMNGAMWGQCDAIYATFAIWSLYALLKRRDLMATILFGVSLSFKFQGLLLLPVFLLAWAGRRYRIHLLPIALLVFCASLIPAWLAGRSFLELLLVYPSQTAAYRSLTMGAPTLYTWLSNDHYDLIYPAGMCFAAAVMIFPWLLVLRRRRAMNDRQLILTAALVFTVLPFVLPKMHDRYFYLADVLTVALIFVSPRLFWIPILLQITSGFSYLPFLAGQTIFELRTLSCLVLIAIVALSREFIREMIDRPGLDHRGAS